MHLDSYRCHLNLVACSLYTYFVFNHSPFIRQVLVEQGVLVDEIKLYGEPELYESLDESLVEESFSELEEVITKVGMSFTFNCYNMLTIFQN